MFTRIRLIVGAIGLFSASIFADKPQVFTNSLGPVGGRFIVGAECPLTSKVGLDFTARYVNTGNGILSSILFPVNIDRMYNLSGSLGLHVYPFMDSRGAYGSIELEAGYHSTRMNERHTPSLDSIEVDGYFIAPAAKVGYKWLLLNKVTLSPEIGAYYKFNTTDYSRISQLPSAEFEDAFAFSRNQLKQYNNGLHPFLAVNLGYCF